ncbi:MAG: caspase family protein [Archangium sp.]|nr:caspase family protein [Archangium sp.]MDP3575551.1 caspase family protein [Archangium sp.]
MRLLLLLIIAAASVRAETIRFAVVVGNNAGRGALPPLRYAEGDAGKFARVLLELGDVSAERMQLLQGRQVKDLEQALLRVREQIDAVKRTPENRAVLLFYFSGHSDGEGLELGNEVLPYSRLKGILAGTGDVRVVVVDACRSGAGYREKGGKPTEAFAIKLTDNLQSTGDAYIASSAESEAALESNEVLGSIFTHHFVSGLRGVADLSGDRLVTLGEAYRYAYDQTVSRTVLLPAGVQHPTYDYKLSGQGELVLSTLQRANAQLILPPGTERGVVTDVLRDQVIAEIANASTRELALPAGEYGVRVFKSGQSFGGRIALNEGTRREVKWEELRQLSNSVQVAQKGAFVAQTITESDRWPEERMVGLSGGIVPAVAPLGLQGAARLSFDPRLSAGLSFALVGSHTSRGTVSESAAEARVGWRYAWRFGLVWLGLGAEVGPSLIWQQTGAGVLFSFAGIAAPRASVRLLVGGPFVLTLDGEAAVALLSLDGKVAAAFRPSGTVGVGFRF